MGTYQEKLSDPRWQKKRLEIFERDNWACQKCSDRSSTLAIHHKWYKRWLEPWEYPDETLITICENCHKHESYLQIGTKLPRRYCFNCYHAIGAYCACREVIDMIKTPNSCPDWCEV